MNSLREPEDLSLPLSTPLPLPTDTMGRSFGSLHGGTTIPTNNHNNHSNHSKGMRGNHREGTSTALLPHGLHVDELTHSQGFSSRLGSTSLQSSFPPYDGLPSPSSSPSPSLASSLHSSSSPFPPYARDYNPYTSTGMANPTIPSTTAMGGVNGGYYRSGLWNKLDGGHDGLYDLRPLPSLHRRDSDFSLRSHSSLRSDRADSCTLSEEDWPSIPPPVSNPLAGRFAGMQTARRMGQRLRKWMLVGFRRQMPISDLVDLLYGIDIRNAEFSMEYDGGYAVVIFGSSDWSDAMLTNYLNSNPVDGQIIRLHGLSEESSIY